MAVMLSFIAAQIGRAVKPVLFTSGRLGVIKSGCGPGDWKVALTRRLESLRYVVPTFLSAGSGDIPVPGSMLRLAHF